MAKIRYKPVVETQMTLSVNEEEMRALDALVGYGTDNFLKIFYEKLGKAYLQPHEKGLRSLFKCVREELPSILSRADDARKAFEQ